MRFYIFDVYASDNSSNFVSVAEFDRLENGNITARVKYLPDASGKVVFALCDADGKLKSADVFEISTSRDDSVYTYKNAASGTVMKVLIWDDELKPQGKLIRQSYDSTKAIPDFLRVTRKGFLAKKNGDEVVLKGINFGGWLVQETWMCPVFAFNKNVTVKSGSENGWANLDTLTELETRFGKEEAASLVKQYEDNYITEYDFENVKNLGFNCIRIPFWYRNFMSDEDGTYITANDDDNPGFKRLDWACEMADKYGLYLILDMHGCPGGQNGDHSCGKTGRNYLYYEEKYQNIMENLWVKIANRYKDRECVAAYDIMNEPYNNSTTSYNVISDYAAAAGSDKAKSNTNKIYDRMIKAIRKVDPYHVISIQGIWAVSYLPNPVEMGEGWTDIMFSGHYYNSGTDLESKAKSLNWYRTKFGVGVAVYVGEFNPDAFSSPNFSTEFNNYNINYTVWNYKAYSPSEYGQNAKWGLCYRNLSEADLYAVSKTSEAAGKFYASWSDGAGFFHLGYLSDDEIKNFYKKLWTEKYLSTKNFTLNTTLQSYLK